MKVFPYLASPAHRGRVGVVAASAALALGSLGVSSAARGQWSVTNLHPTSWEYSGALGAFGPQQVGSVGYSIPTGGEVTHASMWNGSAASWIDLHPAGFKSVAYATSGEHQVGYIDYTDPSGPTPRPQTRASLWSGTAASWVNLHPFKSGNSAARGVFGSQQVGEVEGRASLWSGTASSWVDLHPKGSWIGSVALGTSGTHQVGYVGVLSPGPFGGLDTTASLWSGTAASWVSLHPAGATTSEARGIFGTQQVGVASIGGVSHAGLWSGTAESLGRPEPRRSGALGGIRGFRRMAGGVR